MSQRHKRLRAARLDPRRRAAEAEGHLRRLIAAALAGDAVAAGGIAGTVCADPELAGATLLVAAHALAALGADDVRFLTAAARER